MEFIFNNIWLIGLVFLSGFGLVWPALQQKGSHLNILQATQLMNQEKAVVIDVRSPAEFATGHLAGARNIPVNELPQKAKDLDKLKAKSIILVCASGMQSSKARSQLKSAGFDDVFVLSGGLEAWQAQGLPTAK